jgi:hypothetical protein
MLTLTQFGFGLDMLYISEIQPYSQIYVGTDIEVEILFVHSFGLYEGQSTY